MNILKVFIWGIVIGMMWVAIKSLMFHPPVLVPIAVVNSNEGVGVAYFKTDAGTEFIGVVGVKLPDGCDMKMPGAEEVDCQEYNITEYNKCFNVRVGYEGMSATIDIS